VMDFEKGFVINMETGESSPQYSNPVAGVGDKRHAMDLSVSASGAAIVTDLGRIFGWDSKRRAFLYPVPGDAQTFRAITARGKDSLATFCGEKILTYQTRTDYSATRMFGIKVRDGADGMPRAIKQPKHADIFVSCDNEFLYTENDQFSIFTSSKVGKIKLS
jgi:hypothetical protein